MASTWAAFVWSRRSVLAAAAKHCALMTNCDKASVRKSRLHALRLSVIMVGVLADLSKASLLVARADRVLNNILHVIAGYTRIFG